MFYTNFQEKKRIICMFESCAFSFKRNWYKTNYQPALRFFGLFRENAPSGLYYQKHSVSHSPDLEMKIPFLFCQLLKLNLKKMRADEFTCMRTCKRYNMNIYISFQIDIRSHLSHSTYFTINVHKYKYHMCILSPIIIHLSRANIKLKWRDVN